VTSKATYKIISYNDGTTNYTDISDYNIADLNVPFTKVNNDFSPIFEGLQLETTTDQSSGVLQNDDTILIAIDQDGTEYVRFVGYVYRMETVYSAGATLYRYEIRHIFDKLKDVTTTDLYDTSFSDTTSKTLRESNIRNGISSNIDWYDVTLYGVFEQIFASDWYDGLTFDIDYTNCSGNMQEVLDEYCLSSLCLRYLGTDYSDEEITSGTEDLVNCWDLIRELLKTLGVKAYFNFDYNSGSPTATVYLENANSKPTKTTFTDVDVNTYAEQLKELTEQKRFILKQSMLTIQDNTDENNIHYYFSPLMYGIPNQHIYRITTSGSNLLVQLYGNHYFPATGNRVIREINFLNEGAIRGALEVGEEWVYIGVSTIDAIDRDIAECRYIRVNLGSTFPISQIDYNINKTTGVHYAEIDSDDAGWGAFLLQTYDITIGGFFNSLLTFFFSGTYTHNSTSAGAGYPATAGQYNIDSTSGTVKITVSKTAISNYTGTVANDGNVTEGQGSAGTPNYITNITEKNDYNPTGGGNTTVKVITSILHGITAGDGDTLFIFNTGLTEYDGNSWTENNVTNTNLSSGEYRVIDANTIYIYDDGEDNIDYAKCKVVFPKYDNKQTLVSDGRSETSISLMDYLVIYRPGYSSAGDWKQDWFTVDFEAGTNNLLMNLDALTFDYHTFWNLYQYSQNYTDIISRTINIDDDPTTNPAVISSKQISYNLKDHSIDIIQDDTT
jgi:hypothetical protein